MNQLSLLDVATEPHVGALERLELRHSVVIEKCGDL